LLLTGLALLINNVISFLYVKRRIKFKFDIKHFEMKYVSEMFLVFIAINSGVMYFHLDKVILANDNNIADVSFYGLGERIILLLVTLMTAAISFLTPKLSNLRVVGQESLNLLNHNYRLVLLLLCP